MTSIIYDLKRPQASNCSLTTILKILKNIIKYFHIITFPEYFLQIISLLKNYPVFIKYNLLDNTISVKYVYVNTAQHINHLRK